MPSPVSSAQDAEPTAERSRSRDTAKIETAYRQLKHDITSGVYSPNERLVEAPLAQTLGISRNTLRAVLARLESDGLVVLEPNRGGRVRAFSLEDARDILQVREVLEGLVAGLAAERATPEQRTRLREVVEATEQALKEDDLMRYTSLNREFHSLVIEAADSPRAATMLDSLLFPLVKFQFQAVMVPGRKANSLKEHRAVLLAIEAGDTAKAERVARAHIKQVDATLDRFGPETGKPTD
ncbi:putative GntR family transcriptional regulator [Actinacidiphila reveromycinica]|uniref:Putative GntR family transcriptional regulator n=1 Tax=Actinacidiphila reveromycinica TaxID=659352 RepID=A0A7U3VS01_9ACTN|nr:GntR family transcriptional regulator [Streptomyces sp. SN-593]BBB01335.1 putative GntR family transcriptional regulator [Streptomyces sp. SN-593]